MAERQSDDILFEAVKRGDTDAFEILFKIHYSALCQRALSIVKENEIAEELVSDVFYGIWNKRESISIHTSVMGYLHFATRNHCLNYLKTKKTGFVQLDEVENQLKAGEGNPIEQMISDEIMEEWEVRIQQLPPQRQKLFRMNRLEGLTYAEIAKEMDLSELTVRNQVHIALKTLASYMIVGFGFMG